MSRTKADEYKEFDKDMSSGKIFNAIRSLTVEPNGGFLFLTDKVDMKTDHDILREKDRNHSKQT